VVLTRVRRATSAPLFVLGLSLCAGTSLGDPLGITDQNPLLSGYGLPGPLPANLDAARPGLLSAQYSWGNSAIAQTSARETLVVDAETRELRITAQHVFANGYAVRLQLPYRTVSAGSLDGFIDNWHDTFGLPEGARPSFEKDSLRLLYRRDGMNLIDSRESSSGIGDVSLDLGRELGRSDQHSVALWVGVSLPTGEANDFTGSGSLDITAAVSTDYRLSLRWNVFGQLAATWIGEGDRLPRDQRDWAVSAMLGITARATDALSLTLQFDGHTAVFDTQELNFLSDAVMVSLGGNYELPQDWTVSLGLTEDIAVESTSDVVFLFELKKRW
jgi:hypothetical protein